VSPHRSGGATPGSAWVRALARGGLANLVGAGVSALAGFALVLAVTHALSPSSAGVFFSVTSLFLILESLGRLGADVGLVYFIARWRAQGLGARIRPAVRFATTPVVVSCAAVGVAGIAFAPQLARLFDDDSRSTVDLIRLLAVTLPVAAAYQVTLGGTRGFGWMGPTVLVERVGRSLVQLALVAGVLVAGWRNALGYAWALPYVGGLLLAGTLLWRRLRAEDGRRGDGAQHPVPSAREARREFWAFALPRAVAGVAQIVVQRLDIVLVAVMRGPRDAAVYTAATRFLVVGQLVNQALTAPVQPQLSAAFAIDDRRNARQLYELSTAWLVLGSWPLFATAAVLAPEYVHLFGSHYAGGASVVVILSLAMLVASGVGLVDTVIIMAGRTTWNLETTLLALVVNVGLDLALIPPFGIVGAAIGWFGSIVAANLVPLWIAWRWLGLQPFGRTANRALALAAASWVLLPLAGFLGTGRTHVGALLGLVAGALVYATGLWRWRSTFRPVEVGGR
jgi:O-antigen/teichoic acid export membrane protein